MPLFSASAPGKIILFGEHAVVYGRSAIAAPVSQIRAKVTVIPNLQAESGRVEIHAPDIGLQSTLDHLPESDPIATAVRILLQHLNFKHLPACTIKITSTIPVASGLGSGASVSVALLRALAGFLGKPLPNDTVSTLAYEVEKIHHGTPSGIDNTVVAYEKPIFFTKGQPIETIKIKAPFTIIIGDTGIPSPTKETVKEVKEAWQLDTAQYDRLFSSVDRISNTARAAIESGHPESLGSLMDENHLLLREMGVSSPQLNHLVEAAKSAGALGAKLSGGGRGGNMIALVKESSTESVSLALKQAGAVNTIITLIQERSRENL